MSKKSISFVLILTVLISVFSVFSFADNNSVYSITVDGKTFKSNTSSSGNGWSFANEVLTLNNYTGSTIISTGDLTVKALNNVSVSGASSENYSASSCGFAVTGSLVLNIFGNVSINGENGGEAIVADNVSITSHESSNLNIAGGSGAVAIKANDIFLKVRYAEICGGSGASAVYFAKSFTVEGFTNATFTSGAAVKSAISYLKGATYSFDEAEQIVEFNNKNSLVIVSAKKDFIYGDCNSDKNVSTKDIVLLAQYLANCGVTIDESAADCNNDHSVDIKDAVLLVQYLARWNVYLG